MIALVAVGVFIAFLVAAHAWRQEQLDRKWRAERQRLQEYGERLAARNGHPHSGDVISISERRDREENDMTDLTVTDGILLPATIDQVKAAMTAYLDTTRAVLDASDWQGPPDKAGSFVKKSGWQKIAKAYRLSTELVSQDVDRDDAGQIIRAGAVIRATAPNGQHREATGYCDIQEPRFATQGGRTKVENDLRNTAATRAENRAISNLCGFGAVSAEEVSAGEVDRQPAGGLPPWAQPGDVAHTADQLVAILKAMRVDPDRVTSIGNHLFAHCDQTIPRCVVEALDLLALSIEPPDAVEVDA